MSTSLCFVTDSNYDQATLKENLKLVLSRLNSLNLSIVEDSVEDEWVGEEIEDEIFGNYLDFSSNTCFSISMFGSTLVFSTIYKYSLLYNSSNVYWFKVFREEIFRLIEVFNATEVIFLADNNCDKLNNFLLMAEEENLKYDKIKKLMVEEFGNPIMDYSLLKLEQLNYEYIIEFILDDFEDYKNE